MHGGAGVDLATSDADAVLPWLAAHRRDGVGTMLASLPALAPTELAAALDRLRPSWESGALAGVHLEGPFLSPARAGAHAPAALCAPESTAGRRVRALLAAQPRGLVRTLTLAPELEGAEALADELAAADTLPCLGHTDATAAQAAGALGRWGAAAPDGRTPVVTHLFNAMRPFHHRDPGPVPVVLAAARRGAVRLELIADGVHVADEVTALLLTDADLAPQVCLVSDAVAATGAAAGSVHRLGPCVVHAGVDAPRLGPPGHDGDGPAALAGGAASLADVVARLLAAGLPADAVLRAAVHVPRRTVAGAGAPDPAADGVVLWKDDGARTVLLPTAA